MSYPNIERGWNKLMDDLKKGDERDKEIWRKIMKDIRKSGKTSQGYVRELCEKNRRKNEEKIKKLESEDTDDLERWIILTELLGTYGLLALTGYVPSFLQKKYNEMVKKRKKYKSNERRKKK